MSGNQIAYTCCFDSDDATRDEDGSYLFHVSHAASRLRASRVMLASFEFPMVQYSIEEGRNRLYLNESHLPREPLELVVQERWRDGANDKPRARVWSAALPAVYNPVEDVVVEGETQTLRFRTAHCLYPGATGGLALRGCEDAAAELDAAEVVDARTLRLRTLADCGRAFLSADGAAHYGDLCAQMTALVRRQNPSMRLSVEAASCRLKIEVAAYPTGLCRWYSLRLEGSFIDHLGVTAIERRFQRDVADSLLPDATAREVASNGDALVRNDRLPLVLWSDVLGRWKYVELTPGWYQPSHRTFNHGPPARAAAEASLQWNRLHFFPKQPPDGELSEHFLVLHVNGSLFRVGIPYGVYTCDTMCAYVTTACREVRVELVRENDCFVFRSDRVFSLIFDHADSVDAQRFGFDEEEYNDRTSYTSRRVPCGGYTNHYQLSEEHSTVRFSLAAVALPRLKAYATGTNARGVTELRTFLAERPFSAGLVAGAEVVLEAAAGGHEVIEALDGGVVERRSVESHGAFAGGRAVVVESRGNVLVVHCDAPPASDRMISVRVVRRPFSVCSGVLQGSLGCQLGFPKGIYHGEATALRAPNVFCLDHVDYVLLYLEDVNHAGVTLSHQSGSSTTTPFVKLVMYPLLREERMLPRETSLASGQSLNRFRLRVCNPDGTLYNFHGARFSFSLNIVYT